MCNNTIAFSTTFDKEKSESISISKSLKYLLLAAIATYVNVKLNYPYGDYIVPIAADIVFAFLNIILGIAGMCMLNKAPKVEWWSAVCGAIGGAAVYIVAWQTLNFFMDTFVAAVPVAFAQILTALAQTLFIGLYLVATFLIACFILKSKPSNLLQKIKSSKKSKGFFITYISMLVATFAVAIITTWVQTRGARVLNAIVREESLSEGV